MSIRRQFGAFDLPGSLDDDSVVDKLAAVRQALARAHELIELGNLLVSQDDLKASSRRWQRAIHEPYLVADATVQLAQIGHYPPPDARLYTASRTARTASPESPKRCRRYFSSAPTGWRFCGARGSQWATPA